MIFPLRFREQNPRRLKMNKRQFLTLIGLLTAILLSSAAIGEEQSQFNLVITAGGCNGFFRLFRHVEIYAVDSVSMVRAEEPTTTISPVVDPAEALLAPGQYDMLVYVPWVGYGVFLGRVEILEGQLVVFDISELPQLPEELIIR